MKKYFFVLALFVLSGGVFLFSDVQAENIPIVINEIGAFESTGYEWVEIKNISDTTIDLKDWKFWEGGVNHGLEVKQSTFELVPGAFALIVQDEKKFLEKYPSVTSTIFDSSWGSLNESGEEIGLKNKEGNFVEKFMYVSSENFSLQKIDPLLSDYTNSNWREFQNAVTPGEKNTDLNSLPQNIFPIVDFFVIKKVNTTSTFVFDASKSSDVDGTVEKYLWDFGDTKSGEGKIVEHEYVASGTYTLNLKIQDNAGAESGSSTKIIVDIPFNESSSQSPSSSPENIPEQSENSVPEGGVVINEFLSDPEDEQEEFVELFSNLNFVVNLEGWYLQDGSESDTFLHGSITPRNFFVIEKPKGSLNNSGDIIFLFNSKDEIVDQVTYGNWKDESTQDNAPVGKDGQSVSRRNDGEDTNYDKNDFVITKDVTKASANIVQSETEQNKTEVPSSNFEKLFLTEIFPNPFGSDTENEFIEIFNPNNHPVNLEQWKISDASTKYILHAESLPANSYLSITRKQSGISLNNSGGEVVSLFSPDGTVQDSVEYSGSATEGQSYAKNIEETFVWTLKPTPGKENIVEQKNLPPVVTLDGDSEGTVGEFIHFDASDTVDPENDTLDFRWDFGDGSEGDGALVEHAYEKAGKYTVLLKVSDSSENEVKKTLKIHIQAGEKSLSSSSSGLPAGLLITEILSAPPKGEEEFVELFNSSNEEVDLSGLKLDDEEGGSRPFVFPLQTVLQPGGYKVFSKIDTKLSLNNSGDSVRILDGENQTLLEVEVEKAIAGASFALTSTNEWLWTKTPTPGEQNIFTDVEESQKKISSSKSKSKKIKQTVITTLAKVREQDVGDIVQVTGTVAVAPGVLSTQYFYIAGEAGLQIYSQRKTFPSLKVGDEIQVTGEVGETSGETRLKVKEKSQIQILGSQKNIIPELVEISQVDETYEGKFIQIKGEITEIKSSYLYIDDGSSEMKVYFKRGTGIQKNLFHLSQMTQVKGIVSQIQNGYQLLPRGKEDFVFLSSSSTPEEGVEGQKNNTGNGYITATAGGLTSLLLGFVAKARGKTAIVLLRKIPGLARGLFKTPPKA